MKVDDRKGSPLSPLRELVHFNVFFFIIKIRYDDLVLNDAF